MKPLNKEKRNYFSFYK